MKIQEYLNKIIEEYEKTGGYSLEQLNSMLDETKCQEKYGENWKIIPKEVTEFYRAQGYLEAIKASFYMKLKKLPEMGSLESEKLIQEVMEKIKSAVTETVNQYLG